MFQNYFKIAIRNLIKNKAYSLINILGLAIGITSMILILLFIRDELSYDSFHSKGDRIYRVTREWLNADGETSLHLGNVAPPIAPLLQNDFSNSIEKTVRIRADYYTRIKHNNENFIEENFFWAEPAFLEVFDYQLLAGDRYTALTAPNSLIVTEDMALKYFGEVDVVGKILNYEDQADLKITAVIENPPDNTHFQFDFLGSFLSLEAVYGADFFLTNWGRNNYLTYVLLKPGVRIDAVAAGIPDFLDKHLTAAMIAAGRDLPDRKPHATNRLHFQPIKDIHLRSEIPSEAGRRGSMTTVYIFAGIAVFVLLIACINFMNLATARSSKRSREIGLRKVLGAYREQLIYQFIGESILITFVALLIAIMFTEALLPSFNAFVEKNLALEFASEPLLLVLLLVLMLVVGIVAGSYPAFYLSAFRPVKVLKDTSRTGSGGAAVLRRALVIFQFAISISLIVSMGIVYNQMEYFRNRDLGFDKQNVVLLPGDRQIADRFETVRAELLNHPDITAVAGSRLVPSDDLVNSWSARTVSESGEEENLDFRLAVVEHDYHYLSAMGVEMAAGRDYSPQFGSDDSTAFIVNEAAVRVLGWGSNDAAIGKRLFYGYRYGHVVGVTKDFNFESLHKKIVPVIFVLNPQGIRTVSVRIRPENTRETLSFLESKWREFRPDYPFTYSFLDGEWEELYRSEEKLGQIFGLFSILAVVIACLGLFGLTAFAAEQRTKEIGIRKVMGASVSNLVSMLSLDFLKLVLAAMIIAWAVSWFVMNRWLENFAYSIELSPWTFVLAGMLAMLIAVLTVSYQSIRAAIANPVKSLRYE